MACNQLKKWVLTALCTAAVSFSAPVLQSSFAQSHSGSEGGHSDGDHGGGGGKKLKRGATGERGGSQRSLHDVFRDMEVEEAESEHGSNIKAEDGHEDAGSSSGKKKVQSGRKVTGQGKPATVGKKPQSEVAVDEVDEDSDRPSYAGTPGPESKPGRPNTEPGVKKGTIYGDMYVVERDEDGEPELVTILVEGVPQEVEQVYYTIVSVPDGVDSALVGTTGCCMDRDEAGDLVTTKTISVGDVEYAVTVAAVEVELGRLSVGRSPERVLAAQLDDAITAMSADNTTISFDLAGRIVLTTVNEDETTTVNTIDSPLQNLSLYTELLNTGTIIGLSEEALTALGIDYVGLVNEDGNFVDEDGNLILDGDGNPIVWDETHPDWGDVSESELELASSLMAAASDKLIAVSVDSIVYMNEILGIYDSVNDDPYVDYSSYVYSPFDIYGSQTITIVQEVDGVWTEVPVEIYTDVLGYETGTDPDYTNVAAFALAADDARKIIDYLHANLVVTN